MSHLLLETTNSVPKEEARKYIMASDFGASVLKKK
jgi:hypothetical protein